MSNPYVMDEVIKGETERKIKHLEQQLSEAVEIIQWYGNGGHPQVDMWHHPGIGHFTGKRAREFLAKFISSQMSGTGKDLAEYNRPDGQE